jgi:hypothetical protein
MATVNYSFQKNLKEQARKKKQEEKRLLKLNKKMQAKEHSLLAQDQRATPEADPGQAVDNNLTAI